jgi:hypothetical protein
VPKKAGLRFRKKCVARMAKMAVKRIRINRELATWFTIYDLGFRV